MSSEQHASTLESRRLQAEYNDSVRSIAERLHRFAISLNPVVADFMKKAADMQAHVSDSVEPFNVAVFGRMKAGKSSLINALVGRRLAITGVNESTATINRLTYASGAEQLGTFRAHWRDAGPETFPLERLPIDWNGKDESVLERIRQVKYLELFADVVWLRDVQVTDTPGTDSTVSGHEDVAQQFINGKESDALIYVFTPVARGTDEDDLQRFRSNCLPGSDPYNSVAVMHKWDETYWQNGGNFADIQGKADRLYHQMKSLVAAVIPVSGPLALIAQMASPDFWQDVLVLLASFSQEAKLRSALAMDRLWITKPAQASLYRRAKEEYDMPWASFRVMLREIYHAGCSDVEAAVRVVRKLSGIDALRTLLDKQFFKKSAVIRLNRTRTGVQSDVKSVRRSMEESYQQVGEETEYLQRIAAFLSDSRLRSWVEKLLEKRKSELDDMQRGFVEIDRLIIETVNKANVPSDSLELIPWVSENAARFSSPEQVEELLNLLRFGTPIPLDHREGIYIAACRLTQDMNPNIRKKAEMLQSFLIKSFSE